MLTKGLTVSTSLSPWDLNEETVAKLEQTFLSPVFSLSFIFSLDRSQSGLQVGKGLWIELEVAHRLLPVVVEQQVAHVLGGLLGHDLLDVLGQTRVGKVGEGWDLNMLAGYGEFEQRIEKRVI